MKKIMVATLSLFCISGCSIKKPYDSFPASNGTESMAYCVATVWKKDALENDLPADNISIIENRAGAGVFYVFERNGDEIVAARGTIGWFGKHEGNIDINFYVPDEKKLTELTKRRLFLTKECAKIPSQERKANYLKNVVCTDLEGCNFRRN